VQAGRALQAALAKLDAADAGRARMLARQLQDAVSHASAGTF
jgi:hypothetical protein